MGNTNKMFLKKQNNRAWPRINFAQERDMWRVLANMVINSLICSVFRALIKCINSIKKTKKMHFGFINVILLHSDR